MRGYDLLLSYNWGAMDAVLAHTLYVEAFGLAPLIHHEDGFNEDEARRLKAWRNWYRRIALGRSAALVVPSRRLERIAREVWHQPESRIHRIANGIPTAAYAKKPKLDGLPSLIKRKGELWLGTLAGLRAVKDLPALVRAFAALPTEWQLVILGEGPERAAIESEAQRLGLEHRVHLPGFVADPARVAGLFDIFALSSKSEQFPISLVEAMAAGRAGRRARRGRTSPRWWRRKTRASSSRRGDEEALFAALDALSFDFRSAPFDRRREPRKSARIL